MMQLRDQNQKILVPELEVANNLWTRGVGLLGRRDLAAERGLWIQSSNSVHTCFMRFAIDLVFLNRDMVVMRTIQGVRPWRVTWPVWRAASVIELKEGFLKRNPLRVGDQLHVDSALS